MALSPQERSRRMRLNMLMAMSYAVAGRSTWTPSNLFAAGEQGAWYDFSDFSTMFQDAAGTTPVTAVEQPVGLILDKSRSLAIGPELITNGTFDSTTTGWTPSSANAVLSVDTGRLKVANGNATQSYAYQSVPTVVGKTYRAKITVIPNGTSPIVRLGIAVTGTQYSSAAYATQTSLNFLFVATSTEAVFTLYSGSAVLNDSAFFDNISITELAGNHASQTTSTSRPVLSARVNLLTYTEQFDNAAWTKYDITVPATAETSPIGTATADKVAINAAASYHGFRPAVFTASAAAWKFSIYAKAGELSAISLSMTSASAYTVDGAVATFDLSAGTVSKTAGPALVSSSIESVGSGWYRCTITAQNANIAYAWVWLNSTNNPTYTVGGFGHETFTGTSGHSVTLWGADLRSSTAGSSLPPYQRVGAATAGSSSAAGTGDYDTTGFPYYLRDDLVDDTMNWTATAGSNYTVAWVERGGTVTIQTAQSLSGSTDMLRAQTVAGYVAVNRALTSTETTNLTAWLTDKGNG